MCRSIAAERRWDRERNLQAIGRGRRYIEPPEKRCRHCEETKPIDEFYPRGERQNGRRSRCRSCIALINAERERRGTSPEKRTPTMIRERALRRYGLTLESFDTMLRRQDGGCKVCRGPALGKGNFHVDHCHETGTIRGLLCHKCNVALGMVQDNESHLLALIEYLRSFK